MIQELECGGPLSRMWRSLAIPLAILRYEEDHRRIVAAWRTMSRNVTLEPGVPILACIRLGCQIHALHRGIGGHDVSYLPFVRGQISALDEFGQVL